MRKIKDGGIINIDRITSDKVDMVKDVPIYGGIFNCSWGFNITLSEWVKQTEKRLEKIEELTKVDDYEYLTETKLVKKPKLFKESK